MCFFCTPCSTCNEKDDMKEKENGNTIEHKTGKKNKKAEYECWLDYLPHAKQACDHVC